MSQRSGSTPANGVKLSKCDSQNWNNTSQDPTAVTVKLAGEEAKDRLYEPKHKMKVVRALTVVAYVFCVSLAAIALSIYYIFIWRGGSSSSVRPVAQPRLRCDNGNNAIAERQRQPLQTDYPVDEIIYTTDPPTFIKGSTPSLIEDDNIAMHETNDNSLINYEDIISNQELERLEFIKKLMKLRDTPNEND